MKRLFGGKDEPADDEDEPIGAPSTTTPASSTADPTFDELRTGFTAAVSHELRTPLARILALLDSA